MGVVKKFMTEFKEFALKGSVVDMAIGVIIGAAFKDIVTSFTDSFINPLIASIGGSILPVPSDFPGLTIQDSHLKRSSPCRSITEHSFPLSSTSLSWH